MRCWNCDAEFEKEDLDICPNPTIDILAGLKIYDCYCPYCGAAVVILTEEELY